MGFSSASSNSAELDKHRDYRLHSAISRLRGRDTRKLSCTERLIVRCPHNLGDCAMQEEIPMFVQLCGVGRSGRKALERGSSQQGTYLTVQRTPMNNAQGLFYLKFLTADYGLWVLVLSLCSLSGGWGFRACGRDQDSVLDLPGGF